MLNMGEISSPNIKTLLIRFVFRAESAQDDVSTSGSADSGETLER